MAKSSIFGKQLHVILDIGYSSVKIAQLTNGTLDFLDVALIPPMENEERRKYEILRAIRNFISTYKIKLHTIDLVITDSSTFVRHLKLRSSESRLEPALLEVMSTTVPYDLSSAQVNYEVTGESMLGDEPVRELIAVSLLKNVVKSMAEILSKLGLSARSAQCSPLAMQGFIDNYYSLAEQGVLVLDLGARKTALNIVDSGKLKLSRNIPWCGKQLTLAIASELDVSYANAEMLKIQFANAVFSESKKINPADHEQLIPKLLAPLFNELAAEINRTILAYQAHSTKPVIDQIILCGGGSKIGNLTSFLQASLNIPVALLQINSNTPIESILKTLQDDKQVLENLHYFNLVIGACFNLNNDAWNFLKHIKQIKAAKPAALNTTTDPKSATIHFIRRWQKVLRNFKFTPTLFANGGRALEPKQKIILGIIILLIGFVGYILYLNIALNNLTFYYNSKKAVYDQTIERANNTRETNLKISEFQNSGKRVLSASSVVYSLIARIASLANAPIQLSSISFDPVSNKLVIFGEDLGNGSAIGSFLQSIQKSPGVNNVQLEYLKETGPQTKAFKITGERL